MKRECRIAAKGIIGRVKNISYAVYNLMHVCMWMMLHAVASLDRDLLGWGGLQLLRTWFG